MYNAEERGKSHQWDGPPPKHNLQKPIKSKSILEKYAKVEKKKRDA